MLILLIHKSTLVHNPLSTIRAKLLVSYVVYIAILLGIAGTSLWFENRRNQVENLEVALQLAEDNIQEADRLLASFLSDETINPTFYETGNSDYLEEWRAKTSQALKYLETLDSINQNLGLETPVSVDSVRKNIRTYEQGFESLIEEVLYRGFKDYGLVGEMRSYIHDIEAVEFTDKALMLMCRRHEKDFFLRKQTQYIGKLKNAAEALEQDIIQKTTPGVLQDSLVQLVRNYSQTFREIVRADERIGFTFTSGLRGRITSSSKNLSMQIAAYRDFTQQTIEYIKMRNQSILLSVIGSGLLLGIFLALFIPQILGKPVRKLSSSIHHVISNNFEQGVEVAQISTRDEIGSLSNDFSFMLNKMQGLLEEVKSNSERIEKKNKLLMDSIRYARQIQGAILPTPELIGNFFPNYFLIYRPLHVVSGDFYWMLRKKDRVYVAVADCTGHGVPGAFMSMIGHTLLNKILNQDNIYEPAAILEVLHIEIKEALHQDENQNTGDGMDIALFSMEYFEKKPKERLITYSGGKIPLFYTENGDLKIAKATKRSIGGGTSKQEQRPFETHVITLEQGDYLYLATDGFADQNNVKREKFGKRKLFNTLSSLSIHSMEYQQVQLEEILDEHQKGSIQRDDITLLALEL